MTCIVIRDDGIEKILNTNGNVKSMQKAVGGYIESFGVCAGDIVAFVNEDGMQEKLKQNAVGTYVCYSLGILPVGYRFVARGPVLLCNVDEQKALTNQQIKIIVDQFNAVTSNQV
jgi:hypothetical protein